MRRLLMIGLFSVAAQSALAQDTEEIIVTGSRISGDEYSEMPAITMTKQADFLIRSVTLTNDTRAATGRAEELYQTIKDLLAAAKSQSGFALAFGNDFLIPLSDENYKIPLIQNSDRVDTSSVRIFVKVALDSGANVAAAIAKLDAFIAATKVSGRTEVKPSEDVSLSLVTPEKYRYEIIKKIVDDTAQLRAAVGPTCKVNISGLEGRVMWQRTDVSELTLYIPHRVEVTDCT